MKNYKQYLKQFVWLFVLSLAFSVGISVRIVNHYRANPVIQTQTIEKIVEASKPFPAVLARIMECESNTMHRRDGQVLMVPNNNKTVDIGIMQINSVHAKDATRLGYDLTVESQNVAYGLHLYDTQGTEPWSASKKCWSK